MESNTVSHNQLLEIASRIAEMRAISGFSVAEMAQKTDTTVEQYRSYEAGKVDLPFTFIHKCSLAFGIGITDLLEGESARLTTYTVTRKGQGITTADEDGILIQNMAPLFKHRLADPYYVRYSYSEAQQSQPIATTTHKGHEFDLVLEGSLRVRVGDHEEVLHAGDSIYYKSSTPHGMIAVDGKDCTFLAMIMNGDSDEEKSLPYFAPSAPDSKLPLLCEEFIKTTEDERGALQKIEFVNDDHYNFAFDTVDRLGRTYPDKLAMLHIDKDLNERRFTFKDIKEYSSQAANYFKSLGIQRGDRVMLVLKRHYQFWFAILGLHKLGAVAIPATDQLQEHDYVYRFQAAEVSAIVATASGHTAGEIEKAEGQCPSLKTKILVGGSRNGWHDFDAEFGLFSRRLLVNQLPHAVLCLHMQRTAVHIPTCHQQSCRGTHALTLQQPDGICRAHQAVGTGYLMKRIGGSLLAKMVHQKHSDAMAICQRFQRAHILIVTRVGSAGRIGGPYLLQRINHYQSRIRMLSEEFFQLKLQSFSNRFTSGLEI